MLCEFKLQDGPLDANIHNGKLMISPCLMIEKMKHQRQMIQVILTKKPNQKKRMKKVLELSKTRLKFHFGKKKRNGKSVGDKIEELAAEFFEKKGINKNI